MNFTSKAEFENGYLKTKPTSSAAMAIGTALHQAILEPEFLPITNAHGVHIRSEKYPLKKGDVFTLYSNQVHGTYRGYPHFAIPGQFIITEVGGVNGGELVIEKTNGIGDPFHCSTHSVYAILTDEWSNYQKATT